MPFSSKDLARFGLATRTAIVVLYLAGIILGFCVLQNKRIDPNQLCYIATRDLPAGYQLHDSDFVFDPPIPAGERSRLPPWLDPVGKYVVDRHPANYPIAQSDLSNTPVINVGKDPKGQDMVAYWFPLGKQSALANVLNADSRLDICAGICLAQNVRVISIVCSGTASTDCYAALELPAESVSKVASVAKNCRLIVRNNYKEGTYGKSKLG